jgi:hypothetical protein
MIGRSMTTKDDQTYSPKETEQRRESALKRMLLTPHKPHKPLGKKGRRDGDARKSKSSKKA